MKGLKRYNWNETIHPINNIWYHLVSYDLVCYNYRIIRKYYTNGVLSKITELKFEE